MKLARTALLALALLPAAAGATDRDVVESLYTQVLSAASAPDLADRTKKILAEGWVTMGNNSGGGGQEQFLKNIGGFGQLIPNLKWEIQEVLRDGNRYIVRGRATGTPVKPLFGVDGGGRSFDIMSIDIHTVENGRIVRTFHLEDWAGALRQLRQP